MAKVLVIDDDSVIRGVLCDLLSEAHNCQVADRAEQALQCLELETYDVILTDIFVPGLGGLEILKRIRLSHPTTPVIVISGTTPEDKEKLIAMGAFAFIQKPFNVEEVEETVNQAIADRLQQDHDFHE